MAGEIFPSQVSLLHRQANGNLGLNTVPASQSNYLFDLALSGAGRFSFVHDVYLSSESAKTHSVEIARTHGSAGDVTVEVLQDGVKIGEVDFADGQIGRKTINATAPASTGRGQLQSNLQLRLKSGSPQSAKLHRSEYTVSELITDDGSEDPNAIWVSGSASNPGTGTGTKTNPFAAVEDALAAVNADTSIKNVYLVGNIPKPNGSVTFGTDSTPCFQFPHRDSESERLWIRSAPGQHAVIDCGFNTAGFHADRGDSASYITLYDFDINNIGSGKMSQDGTGSGVGNAVGYTSAVGLNYATSLRTHSYKISTDHITGGVGSNTCGFHYYGTFGGNIWSCKATNVKMSSDGTNRYDNDNCGGWQSYNGQSSSITNCFFNDCRYGVYQKNVESNQLDTYTARRNWIGSDTTKGLEINVAGNASDKPSFTLCEQNIIESANYAFVNQTQNSSTSDGYRNWFVNNVTVKPLSVRSDTAVVFTAGCRETIIFNNLNINAALAVKINPYHSNSGDPSLLHVSHNTYENLRGDGIENTHAHDDVRNYASIAAFNAATGFEVGSEEAALNFIDTNSYTLAVGAPEWSNGLGGTPRGVQVYRDASKHSKIGLLQ